MGLPSSGALAFSSIQSQFGGSNPISLNEYYRNGSFVPSNQFNTNVPTSGQISVSQFYSTEGFNSFGQYVVGNSGGKIVGYGWSFSGNATYGTPNKISISGPTKVGWIQCSGLPGLAYNCLFMGNSPYNSSGVGSRNSNVRTSSANGPVVNTANGNGSFGFTSVSATTSLTGTYNWTGSSGHSATTTNTVDLSGVNGQTVYTNWG